MSIVETSPGLTAEERDAITAMAAHAQGSAASIDALKYVQSRYRWVSDAHLAEIAGLLGLPVAELEGVATYYNLIFRKPVGERVIFLCDSVSCWVMGRDKVNEHICKRLDIKPGQTSADGAYTLLPIVCLGHCDHAPAMMVGDELHGDVDPDKVDEILDKNR